MKILGEDVAIEITGRRIRSFDRHLGQLPEGATLRLAIPVERFEPQTLQKLGFTGELAIGEKVLPSPVFGPISRYNANGKEIVHRDQPMETASRQAEWHWEEWSGRYGRVPRSKIVDIPYERYPRSFLPPPSLELTLAETGSRLKVVASHEFEFSEESKEQILHGVNLLLEIAGVCHVLTEDLDEFAPLEVRRLNWEVLPRGRHPWADLEPKVTEALDDLAEGTRVVAEYRLKAVNRHEPDFVAVGRAGFRGYLIFGFSEKSLHVLENAVVGNATYILGADWEILSSLTKAEILADDLHQHRLVHQGDWEARLAEVLGEDPPRNRATRPRRSRGFRNSARWK